MDVLYLLIDVLEREYWSGVSLSQKMTLLQLNKSYFKLCYSLIGQINFPVVPRCKTAQIREIKKDERKVDAFHLLHYLAFRNNLEFINLIISLCGINFDQKSTIKLISPLHLASMHGDSHFLSLFISLCDGKVDELDHIRESPLFYAVTSNNISALKILVESGANVNRENKFRENLLYLAMVDSAESFEEIEKMISELISLGAKRDSSVRGYTLVGNLFKTLPFWEMLNEEKKGHTYQIQNKVMDTINISQMISTLAKAGINTNAIQKNTKLTPLYELVLSTFEKRTIIYGHVDIQIQLFKKLVELGADVNHQDKGGDTILNYIVARIGGFLRTDFSEIVEYLLSCGANPYIQNKNGYNSLHLAFQDPKTVHLYYIFNQHSGDINLGTKQGQTILHHACQIEFSGIRKKEMISSLIYSGANVNIKAENGFTVLHFITRCHNTMSRLHVHKWKNESEHDWVEIIKILIREGADINAVANNGKTASDYATPEIAQLLQQLAKEQNC